MFNTPLPERQAKAMRTSFTRAQAKGREERMFFDSSLPSPRKRGSVGGDTAAASLFTRAIAKGEDEATASLTTRAIVKGENEATASLTLNILL